MNGGDHSLGGGLFLAGTLIAMGGVMRLLSHHSRIVHWVLVKDVILETNGTIRVIQRTPA
jgi:hypothetical protein